MIRTERFGPGALDEALDLGDPISMDEKEDMRHSIEVQHMAHWADVADVVVRYHDGSAVRFTALPYPAEDDDEGPGDPR